MNTNEQNDPDFVWKVWKAPDNKIMGPVVAAGTYAIVVYAKLDDLGNWTETTAEGVPLE
jgi:hypothetical protein